MDGIKPLEYVLFLLGFGSILFLTYVTTRYVAGKSKKAMRGKYINIIETVSLGIDKKIHLVKAGEQYFLIASASKSIEFLAAVDVKDGEEIGTIGAVSPNVFDFKAFFEKYMNSYKSNRSNVSQLKKNENSFNQAEGEKFRTNLDKLKTITQKINKQVEKDGDDTTNEK